MYAYSSIRPGRIHLYVQIATEKLLASNLLVRLVPKKYTCRLFQPTHAHGLMYYYTQTHVLANKATTKIRNDKKVLSRNSSTERIVNWKHLLPNQKNTSVPIHMNNPFFKCPCFLQTPQTQGNPHKTRHPKCMLANLLGAHSKSQQISSKNSIRILHCGHEVVAR